MPLLCCYLPDVQTFPSDLRLLHALTQCDHAAGAIYANDTSNLTVLDSMFIGNGGGQGGAISVWNSSILVNGTTFYKNKGNSAGQLTACSGHLGSHEKQFYPWADKPKPARIWSAMLHSQQSAILKSQSIHHVWQHVFAHCCHQDHHTLL